MLDRGFRNELRDAEGSRRTDGLGLEAALLPDQVGEEGDRQIVRLGNGNNSAAQAAARQQPELAGTGIERRIGGNVSRAELVGVHRLGARHVLNASSSHF